MTDREAVIERAMLTAQTGPLPYDGFGIVMTVATICERLYDAGLLSAGWRPISEALEDGTEVIGTDGNEIHATCVYAGGWRISDWNECPGWSPTHYLPLPPPPQKEPGDG